MELSEYVGNSEQIQNTSTETQPTNNAVDTTQGQSTQVSEITPPTESPTTPTYPEFVEIGNEKVPFAEVQKGYLRQSDYTRKTQELAQQRKEAEEALELVAYLRANPHLAQRLVEDGEVTPPTQTTKQTVPVVQDINNPLAKDIQEIKKEMYLSKLDSTLNSLKAKYPDFNEVDVLNRAAELNTDNLEFVYHGMKGQNLESIVAQKVKEQLAQATQQMQQTDGVVSKTLISGGDGANINANHGLSQLEMNMADKLGMSYEEYAKWR